ncbi:hypothetical protein WMY93_006042 [Mugilogobius chulae]|uniref:Uncharacterized protein n=1 Tax=Mugilogobius chulae TaxID=88201 RepID=A0AAW0PIQ4_9GOBI
MREADFLIKYLLCIDMSRRCPLSVLLTQFLMNPSDGSPHPGVTAPSILALTFVPAACRNAQARQESVHGQFDRSGRRPDAGPIVNNRVRWLDVGRELYYGLLLSLACWESSLSSVSPSNYCSELCMGTLCTF